MRYRQAEKMEIIRLVEDSQLSVVQTLKELGIARSSFYDWYRRYLEDGYDGLADKPPASKRFWNRIPDSERREVVKLALDYPEKSPRELACWITDHQGYFISESSIYRILHQFDLISSPAYTVISAAKKFKYPTRKVNELWQTDFTYFKVVGWGWYYLTTVLDDYSRYIIAYKLCSSMGADDVKEVLDMATRKTGIDHVTVRHRPRLLSDNGPCYVSKELQAYLSQQEMSHIRCRPYHPQTQGKIERYHRSLKNVVNLQHYYLPWELEGEIARFVDYYNHQRYHESLNNLTPADVYQGRAEEILSERDRIKQETLQKRKEYNLKQKAIKDSQIIMDSYQTVS